MCAFARCRLAGRRTGLRGRGGGAGLCRLRHQGGPLRPGTIRRAGIPAAAVTAAACDSHCMPCLAVELGRHLAQRHVHLESHAYVHEACHRAVRAAAPLFALALVPAVAAMIARSLAALAHPALAVGGRAAMRCSMAPSRMHLAARHPPYVAFPPFGRSAQAERSANRPLAACLYSCSLARTGRSARPFPNSGPPRPPCNLCAYRSVATAIAHAGAWRQAKRGHGDRPSGGMVTGQAGAWRQAKRDSGAAGCATAFWMRLLSALLPCTAPARRNVRQLDTHGPKGGRSVTLPLPGRRALRPVGGASPTPPRAATDRRTSTCHSP